MVNPVSVPSLRLVVQRLYKLGTNRIRRNFSYVLETLRFVHDVDCREEWLRSYFRIHQVGESKLLNVYEPPFVWIVTQKVKGNHALYLARKFVHDR